MEELVGKLKNILEKSSRKEDSLEGTMPLLSKKDYLVFPPSLSNFTKISPLPQDSGAKTAFIDGGHAVLLESTNFCVGFIRIHAITFKGSKRGSSQTIEAYVVVSSTGKNDSITYQTEILPIKGALPINSLLAFDSLDETIRLGIRRSSPIAMIGIARRFSELHLAMETASQLKHGDMVVLDGPLQKSYTNEEQLLDSLKRLSESKDAPTIMGFCKTNSVFTQNAESFSSILSAHAGNWMYSPVATPLNDAPHLSFCKLHEKSEQAFMIESFSSLSLEHASILSSFSSDSVFLGYPYGLIEADRAARVSNQEASSLQFQLQERLGKSVRTSLASKSAHGTLDRISF